LEKHKNIACLVPSKFTKEYRRRSLKKRSKEPKVPPRIETNYVGPETYKNELFNGFLENVFGSVQGKRTFDFSKVKRSRVLKVISVYKYKRDMFKYNLVTHAIARNLLFIVKLCVEECGYNLNYVDCFKNTYLHWCFYFKRTKIREYLLSKKMNIYQWNKFGLLPSSNMMRYLFRDVVKRQINHSKHFMTFRLNKKHQRVHMIHTMKTKDVILEISKVLFTKKVSPRHMELQIRKRKLNPEKTLIVDLMENT